MLSDRCLEITTTQCRVFAVLGKPGCIGSCTLKDVVDEAVHDVHGFAAYANVRMNLLQHLGEQKGGRCLCLFFYFRRWEMQNLVSKQLVFVVLL